MSEKPHIDRDNQAPQGPSPHQLNMFWEQTAGATDVLTDHNRMVSATVFFHERLAPLQSKPGEPERNKAVREFQTWLPFSDSELNTALGGAVNRIRRAHHTKNGDPRRAVENTYRGYVGFLKDTHKQLDLLEKALTVPEDDEAAADIGKIRELISSDQEFQSLFANYFYQKESLDHYGEKREKKRKGFFHGAVIAAAQHAPDRTIEAMFDHIYSHARHREHFWRREITLVEQIDFVKEMIADPSFTPPSMLRRRDTGEQQEVPQQVEEEVAQEAGKLVIENSFTEGTPPEVMQANIARYAEQTKDIYRKLEQGQKDKKSIELDVLGGYAIWDEEGNVIGVEPRRDPEIATYADAAKATRPHKRRSGFGHKADIGNNDPKVKDTYDR